MATSKWQKHNMFGPLLDVRFVWQAQSILHLCKDAFCVAGAVQAAHASDMSGGQCADFLRWVAFWSMRSRFAKVILRDRCGTLYGPASSFRGRRSTLNRWSRKIAKRIGTRPSALHSSFHLWRKSRRITSFDVVNFENWGSLAELLRFWCCQAQKLRKSRAASFLMLSSSKTKDVSRNGFVFDAVQFKHWGSVAELLHFN